MAKLRDLSATVAQVLGLDGGLVGAYARRARENGLIGGGHAVTGTDAANLLLAACTADQARDVPVVVRAFRELSCARTIRKGGTANGPDEREIWPILAGLDPTESPTLGQALEAMIEAARTGELETFFADLPDSYLQYFPDPTLQALADRGVALTGDLSLELALQTLHVTLRVGVCSGGRRSVDDLPQILPLVLCYYECRAVPEQPPFNRRGDRRVTVRLTGQSILALGRCLAT